MKPRTAVRRREKRSLCDFELDTRRGGSWRRKAHLIDGMEKAHIPGMYHYLQGKIDRNHPTTESEHLKLFVPLNEEKKSCPIMLGSA